MIKEIKVFKNSTFQDKRGFYWTTWKKSFLKQIKFNHDKFSISKRKVLRGLHCDFKSWKLVTCVYGKIFFVVVDMRKGTRKYLKYKSWILSHDKPTLILVPPYFANAHLCLSKKCVFHYKWSYKGRYIEASKQNSYRWNDPKIKIWWPIKKPILSSRDKNSQLL